MGTDTGDLVDEPRGLDPAWRLAAAFLLTCRTENTRRAYARDIASFYRWCAELGVHPLQAGRAHLDAYTRELEQSPQPKTRRPAAPASVARRLSTLSGLYRYGVDESFIERSPIRVSIVLGSATTAHRQGWIELSCEPCSPQLTPTGRAPTR